MAIYQLPIHIFFLIRDYVFDPDRFHIHQTPKDERMGIVRSTGRKNRTRPAFRSASPASWRNFLNTNKEFFTEIKQLTGYYDLSDEVSRGLLPLPKLKTPPSVRATMDRCLQHIKTLELSNFYKQVDIALEVDLKNLPSGHNSIFAVSSTLTAPVTTSAEQPAPRPVVPFLFERLTLTITRRPGRSAGGEGINNNNTISLKAFPYLKHLTIVSFITFIDDALATPSNSMRNTLRIEVDPAMRLESFVTNAICEFIDESNVKLFGNMTMARLTLSKPFPDVSLFGSVRKLDLSNSTILTDVSCLAHVHTLSLSGCKNIEDVSMLGSVYSLNINECHRIVSVNRLDQVRYLSMKGLIHLQDGLPLENALIHLITDATTYDLAGVGKIPNRNMQLSIVFETPSNPFSLPVLRTYSHMPFDFLSLAEYDLTMSWNSTGVQRLTLDSCQLPNEFSPIDLPQLSRLHLIRCEGLSRIRFDRMPRLKVLKINGCPLLTALRIDEDKELNHLELDAGARISVLTIAGRVKRLKINDCQSLRFLDVIGSVQEWGISGLKNCNVLHHHHHY